MVSIQGSIILFNEIISREIDRIGGIYIEYPRKHDPDRYLCDRTSFDTFISYTTKSGMKGGIGIEVKYTEVGYKIGKTEKEAMGKDGHPYTIITTECGYFTDPRPERFMEDHLRQIWRNHILGASMISENELDFFHCIHLYPKGNTHFNEYAIPKYKSMLTAKGKESFIGLTYEDLFYQMGRFFISPQEKQWISYLMRRYLF